MTPRITHLKYDGYTVDVTAASNPEAARWEQELQEAGLRLPFYHRLAAAELESHPVPLFFMIRDVAGAPCGGFAAQRRLSRALPGHSLLRVERFGVALPAESLAVGVRALADVSRAIPRILLRTYLGVFSTEPSVQQEIASYAAAVGFCRNPAPRAYTTTILVDLRPDEKQIFASFQSKTRRDIRAAAKFPVIVRPIEESELAGRLDSLVNEAFTRTNGEFEHQQWPDIIQFSVRHPELSHLVGLFRTDIAGTESLLAFAHGLHHGDYVEYSTAAATRNTDIRVPQTYVLAWDMMRWAKRHGAAFFDFGGVTPVTSDGSDPLQGISAFKRYFSKAEFAVGEEWILEPSRLKANLARVVTSVAKSVVRS